MRTSTIKYLGDFRIFQFTSARCWQKNAKNTTETFVYYIDNGFGMPQHFPKGYDLVFLPKLYCLLIIHFNG